MQGKGSLMNTLLEYVLFINTFKKTTAFPPLPTFSKIFQPTT